MTSLGVEPADPAALRLPAGSLLLHIGPPKTGTTTVQGAFHAGRAAVLAQGVRYVGRSRHSGSGVLAVTRRPSFHRDSGPPPIRKWQELVREVQAADEPRLVLSSEFFADAQPPAIEEIVADLGRDRVHVVVTLRPLASILPSQWQQYVQSFMSLGYPEWLDGVFNRERGAVTPTFWGRHRHDELVERWASAVGPRNVTVVVIDESDHEHVLRVFESLLGLRAGTLGASDDATNRSMTLPEIEAVRAFNIRFRAAGLGNALYHRVMHFGAAAYMKWRRPPSDERRIETPAWALERALQVEREMTAAIGASGARVLGDLAALAVPPKAGAPGAAGEAVCIPPAIATRMSLGIAVVAGLERGRLGDRPSLDRFATYQLMGAIVARWASGGLALLRRFSRRPGGTRPTVAAVPQDADCIEPDVVASMAMDALLATGIVRVVSASGKGGAPQLRRVRWTWIEPPDVATATTRELAGTILRRLLRLRARSAE